MRRTIAVFMVLMLAIAGCASYNPSSLPLPKADSMATSLADGPVTISVDPYVQGDRQKKVFGENLGSAGIIPIRVLLENSGEPRVLARISDIVMVLPDGTRINQAGARAANGKMSSSAGVVMAGVAFGAVGAIAAMVVEEDAKKKRLEDYQRKEFCDANLGKGDSSHGFLYFIPPTGVDKFSSAVLQVGLRGADDATFAVLELPVKDLKYIPPETISMDTKTGFNHQ